jgi:hypothetical protein
MTMKKTTKAVWRGLRGAVSCIVVGIMLWLRPEGLRAQRHGRADSAQQYARKPPETTLTITVDRDHHLMRQKDLASLPRTTRVVAGQTSGSQSARTFTGVRLADLVAPDPSVSHYDIHHGFFHTTHLDQSTLASPPDLLVADVVDGRTIDQGLLFELIATARDGHTIEIGKVTSIALRRGPPAGP